MDKIRYYSVNQAGLSYFKVSGGPFNGSKEMGWHITDEKGFTLGVSCSMSFCDTIFSLLELAQLLKDLDAYYHLSERKDDGFLLCSEEKWEKLKLLFEKLQIK
jgi:hypothetical protein